MQTEDQFIPAVVSASFLHFEDNLHKIYRRFPLTGKSMICPMPKKLDNLFGL